MRCNNDVSAAAIAHSQHDNTRHDDPHHYDDQRQHVVQPVSGFLRFWLLLRLRGFEIFG